MRLNKITINLVCAMSWILSQISLLSPQTYGNGISSGRPVICMQCSVLQGLFVSSLIYSVHLGVCQLPC